MPCWAIGSGGSGTHDHVYFLNWSFIPIDPNNVFIVDTLKWNNMLTNGRKLITFLSILSCRLPIVGYSFHTWEISTFETFFTSRASIPDAGTQKLYGIDHPRLLILLVQYRIHFQLSWCRIVIPASPPGVYPAVEFQDGDLRTKSSMVTRRRRDLDRFGPRCA